MSSSTTDDYPAESLVAAEIARQPDAWLSTLALVQAADLPRDLASVPVILTGAGTSAYAGATIAAAWPGASAIATTDLLLYSREEIELRSPNFSDGGLLISLARSGDSPESTAVVERTKKLFPSVRHLAIVCNPEGQLAHISGVDVLCLDPLTNDRSLAMTGSFSNLALAGLCLLHRDKIAAVLPAIRERAHHSLAEMYKIAEQVVALSDDRLVVLTSGMHGLAVETSLKIVELTAGRMLGMPETFLGLRHGPMSVLRENTPVLCFASTETGRQRYEEDLVNDLRSRGLGRLVVIGDESALKWDTHFRVPAIAPALPDYLRTPFEILFAQVVAYHCSLHVNVDPDNPSPDGTVTRVVRPFLIHD